MSKHIPLTREMINAAPFVERPPVGVNGTSRHDGRGLLPSADDDSRGIPIPLSDTLNGKLLVQAHGKLLRYCGQWGRWLCYEDGIWQEDDAGRVVELAKATMLNLLEQAGKQLADIDAVLVPQLAELEAEKDQLLKEANRTQAPKTLAKSRKEIEAVFAKGRQALEAPFAVEHQQAKACYEHAKRSLGRRKLDDMIALARSEPGIPVAPDVLNTHVMLLPVRNGVVDLKTGELLPHNPSYLFTKKLEVPYDKTANCPRWEKALREMMGSPLGPDSAEDSAAVLEQRQAQHERAERLVKFLQRSFGYMLTGTTHEQIIWIFTGGGSNGKSLVIGTMFDLFGDYGYRATQGLFEEKQFETHPTEHAELFGRRFVAMPEGRENRRLDANFIKAATGGDRLPARRMRENFWTFTPTHHIVMATNHLPKIDDSSHAMWRLVRLVPFDVTFHDPDTADQAMLDDPRVSKQNKNLAQELHEELPGILRWCVDGCLQWQQDGLTYPEEVKLATEAYRRDQNNVGEFVREGCLTGPSYQTRASALYEGYKTWCGQNEKEPCSNSTFGKKMQIPPNLVVGRLRRIPVAARGQDLQVQHPI